MKILIVGAGIGRLAAAGFLEQKGFKPTLIERTPQFKHIGFGMSIFGNGRKILHELGIDKEVSKNGYEVPYVELADVNGKRLGSKIYFKEFQHYGEPLITIERAALHDALAANLRTTDLRLGTTIKEIKSTKEKNEVVFNDGTKEVFDLLIAADGIRSAIREQFFGSGHNKYYGWSLRFFWLPRHIPVLSGAICLSKEKMTLALYPLGKRCFAGIYEYNPKRISNQPLEIGDFLPYMSKHGWSKQDINDLEQEAQLGHQFYDHLQHITLEDWYKKRIVLLGDAKHGVSPITGMGGSMALEDAYVLADELAKNDEKHIDQALASYVKRRSVRVSQLNSLSSMSEKFYFITSPLQRILRNAIANVFPTKILSNKVINLIKENI
jgi:2-polyprenyl-6-methoxyphenol hydroxylase-like FAD-dependent oxidoreductase